MIRTAVYLWLWIVNPVGSHWDTIGAYQMTPAQCARIVADIHAVRSASRVRFACASSPPIPLG